MGHEILYCATCQVQLRVAEFEKGRAFRVQGQAYCAACAPPSGALPPAPDSSKSLTESSSRGLNASSATLAKAIRRSPGGGGPSQAALIGIAVAAIAIVVVLLAAISGAGSAAKPKPAAAAAKADLPVPDEVPAPAPVPRKADREAKPKARTDGEMAREIAEIAEPARALLAKEEFKAALDLYESARGRRDLPEWHAQLSARCADLRQEANRLFNPLKEEAAAARRAGQAETVDRLRERVRRWGLTDLMESLDAHLAAVPAPKPVSPALVEYRSRWAGAAALAAGRDFDAAASEIARAAQGNTDPDVRRESEADAREFREMGAAVTEALTALAATAPGESLRISVRDGSAPPKSVSGKVVSAGPHRIELEGADVKPVFVELADVSAASLAERWENRRAILTLLAALEGTAAAALPEKYAVYSQTALARLPARPPREDEARRLFHAAELEFRSAETLGSAVEKYATLLKAYADTRIVSEDATRVRKRSEAARDYFFGMDGLKGSGTFSVSAMPKVEAAWASGGVSEPSHAAVNFVEFQFAGLADVPYRCWVYAGACCRETFVFSLQAPGLTTTLPRKPLEKLPAGPGDAHSVPVRQTAVLLKATHAGHGVQARQWGWVPVTLPKFSETGLKRVRLLTEAAGFAVAAVSVSAMRTSPPADAELKREFERAKGMGATPPEPGLIAWWKFDDGIGTSATDSSGNGHLGTLVGGASWGKGKFGGCVVLDGVDDHVRVMPSAALNGLTDQMTVAAWVWRLDDQEGWRVIAMRQRGSSFYDQWSFTFGDNISHFGLLAADWVGTKAASRSPKGRWIHRAGTYDGSAVKLYVDGTLADSTKASGALGVDAPRPLILGAGRNEASDVVTEALQGMLDEVRIYNRSLREEEIRALLQGPAADVRR